MKTKHYVKSMVLTLTVTGLCMQSLAGAQTNQKIQPAYTNPAEVRQAVHLAQQNANTTNPSLRESLIHLSDAQNQMDHIQNIGNQRQQISTATALRTAEKHYVSMLTGMTGVSAKDIRNMHTSGVDWANVPREFGLHVDAGTLTGSPGQGTMQQGNMGTGQMNSAGSRNAEIMAATARNTESGWAEGHGTGMQTDVHGNEGGGMMSGAGGLGNGMASADDGGHDGNMGGGMGGGMGADNSGSGSGGSGSSGSSSGSGGMGGGGSSSGGGSGGHGGGSMM